MQSRAHLPITEVNGEFPEAEMVSMPPGFSSSWHKRWSRSVGWMETWKWWVMALKRWWPGVLHSKEKQKVLINVLKLHPPWELQLDSKNSLHENVRSQTKFPWDSMEFSLSVLKKKKNTFYLFFGGGVILMWVCLKADSPAWYEVCKINHM